MNPLSSFSQLPVPVQTPSLLALSNLFTTFAWYAHLKNLASKTVLIPALISWGIALFKYLLQAPAKRIGYTQYSLAQLKIPQEVITLVSVRALRAVLHGPVAQARLSVRRLVYHGRGYFIFRS